MEGPSEDKRFTKRKGKVVYYLRERGKGTLTRPDTERNRLSYTTSPHTRPPELPERRRRILENVAVVVEG